MRERVISQKLWQETFEKFPKNDPKYELAYGLTIWLGGVGNIPGRDSICGKRNKLMWELRRHAIEKGWCRNKILLVGNADIGLTADLGDYDYIGIFNYPRNTYLLEYATHHFMRSDKKDLSHHGGEEYIEKHSA